MSTKHSPLAARRRPLCFARGIRSLGTAACLLAAGCASGTHVPATPSSAKAVVAEGTGKDRASALDDARVQAIRQAVGAYVMTRTRVEMNEITERTILSLSDGSILSTEVLSERVDDQGDYRVRIVAAVANDKVIENLLRRDGVERPAVTDPEGSRRSQQVRTSAASELLRDTIRQVGYPLGLFSVSARMSSATRSASHFESQVECTLRIDELRWQAFRRGSSRCLAALGKMDSPVDWRSRTAGTRELELRRRPPVVGRLMGQPLMAQLSDASHAQLPGPLDNVWVATDPDAADRTVMFIEVEPEVCRAFTLSREAFDEFAPAVTHAATRQPTLRLTFLDDRNTPLGSIATTLDLNLSTGVLLLAEAENGVPSRIRSGAARLLQDESFSATRPLQIVPAIGVRGLLVRELTLRCDTPLPVPDGTADVRASLEW